MNAERALQQVVDPLADVDVQAGVAVLQHDLLLKVLALLTGELWRRRGHRPY